MCPIFPQRPIRSASNMSGGASEDVAQVGVAYSALSQLSRLHTPEDYRDVCLPTAELTPFKDLTHPSMLNKRPRTLAVKESRKGSEFKSESHRERRRFGTTNDVRHYLAGLRRKEAILRQERHCYHYSRPRHVPSSPNVLPRYSKSVTCTMRNKANVDLPLRDTSPPLLAEPNPLPPEHSTNVRSGQNGGCFSSPISQSLFIQQLDHSLNHSLGGSLSPAIASSSSHHPSFFNSTSSSHHPSFFNSTSLFASHPSSLPSPPVDSDPHFAAEGEKVERVDVGFVETSAAPPTFGGRVDCPEERERPSQVPLIGSSNRQIYRGTHSSFSYALPCQPPPPSLSLLHSESSMDHNQLSLKHDSNFTSSSGIYDNFSPATFNMSHFSPREQ